MIKNNHAVEFKKSLFGFALSTDLKEAVPKDYFDCILECIDRVDSCSITDATLHMALFLLNQALDCGPLAERSPLLGHSWIITNLGSKGMYGYRLDLLVENKLILAVKFIDKLLPLHEAHIVTYMKLAKASFGLLINFNVELLKEGIRRFVL